VYHVLLTNRYLTSRVIPLIAVAAVAMCVALVIIVVSVMTGFLDMVSGAGRTLMGDVIVSYPVTGLPRYERLIERIEALPEAAAATPVVDGWGLLKMPYPAGERKQIETVQVWGIEASSFAQVTGYADTIYWKIPSDEALAEMGEGDFRRLLVDDAFFGRERLARVEREGRALRHDELGPLAAILGMHVSAANDRQHDGSYRPVFGPLGFWWMPGFDVTLTMVPVGAHGGLLEPESRVLRVVNEFVSGVFLIDDKRIMVPLEIAQAMLDLVEAPIVDDEGEPTGQVDPARVTMVLARASDGITPMALKERIRAVYEEFRAELQADATLAPGTVPPPPGLGVVIQTWDEQQREFIAPIEKERELMRILFSIVYLVCAGLVLSIFWAIVYEKTRDIGILRSVGASRIGISRIFLRYGAIIGVIGAVLGLGLAWLVVHNINAIHGAMGEPAPKASWVIAFALAGGAVVMAIWRTTRGFMLPVVLWALAAIVFAAMGVALMLHRGTLIWDPSVYYFSVIPNEVDPFAAVTTMIGAVLFSVLGAVLPATKAADTDPVRALRYE
jgi:lipoprotein-releasing system permease protein